MIAALAVTVLLVPDTFTRGVAVDVNAQVDRITRERLGAVGGASFGADLACSGRPRSQANAATH